MGRSPLLVLLTLASVAFGGCTSSENAELDGKRTKAATSPTTTATRLAGTADAATATEGTLPQRPRPAASPAEAMLRMLDASATGDEDAYRRAVWLRPPAARAESLIRSQLASARLFQAVREHGVTGKRVRDAGFDRNERLLVHEPARPEQLAEARQAVERLEWAIEGNTARPANQPSFGSGNSLGKMSVERFEGGWVVVFSDPVNDADPVQLSQMAEVHASTAGIIEAATAEVRAGRFRTILEVNNFITAERDAFATRKLQEFRARPPAGDILIVTDAETGKPIEGANILSQFVVAGRVKELSATTDRDGRARLQDEPNETVHDFWFTAPGYAHRPVGVSRRKGAANEGLPDEVHVKLGRPAVVEIMLELPDDRRAAMSVYEGDDHDPAPPDVRQRVQGRRFRLPVAWEANPPGLPQHDPFLRLHLPSATQVSGKGVVHRVTHARTAAGRELPVFRDGPPPDEAAFGVYEIGRNGLGDTVFVVGTLADARVVASGQDFQWSPNKALLGPTTRPTTRPQ